MSDNMDCSHHEEPAPIKQFKGNYRWLSNFWLCEFKFSYLGKEFTAKSVEHAFQACKSKNIDTVRLVLAQSSPRDAKTEGGVLKIREDWDQIKDMVMTVMLEKKFAIPELRHRLISTGDAVLVEGNWWHDQYWGACDCPKCSNKSGKNTLGALLMKLRSSLQTEVNAKAKAPKTGPIVDLALRQALREMVQRTQKGNVFYYTPFDSERSVMLREHHIRQLKGLHLGPSACEVRSKSGLLIAKGYLNIVVGDYGAYIEIAPSQMCLDNIKQKWPGEPKRPVKYIWMETKDTNKIKVYYQRQTVSYADYQPGMYYVDPHNVIISQGDQA